MGKRAKSSGGAGGELACALRVGFLWAISGGAAIIGYTPGAWNLVISCIASAAEVALYAARHQNKSGKRRNSIRPSGFFPLQLLGIYMVQLWLLMFYYVADPDEAAQHGDGFGLGPPAARGDPKPRPASAADEGGLLSADEEAAASKAGTFELDAKPETLRWNPKTISVVLPCAEEREYAFKTVEAVFKSTPAAVLHEIVVVDDGSEPPLSATHLGEEVQRRWRVKIMRHEETVGLIGAKKTGGDAASGDIIVFFDCHVAPQTDWYKEFLTLSAVNYRRVVVPQITALDVDTWTQIGRGGGLAKCYLTWDADFKWVDGKDQHIPVISGGLLGISRRWWSETGGYDREMLGWGGENLDQSLRVWLCGGEIVMAPHSQVAHMWRDGTKKTQARYKHIGDSNRNRARAVYAWYGEFSEKLKDYPAFRRRPVNGQPWYGNLSSFDEVKQRLGGCRPFAWFLKRFRDIYEDGGLIPSEIFMLRDEQSGMCLRYLGHAGTSGTGREEAELKACNEKDDRFFWHLGNSDSRGRCCSGLHAWNTDQCLNGADGQKATTGICSVSRYNDAQAWELTKSGQLQHGSRCLLADDRKALSEGSCGAFRGGSGVRWTKVGVRVPLETQLYQKALRERPEVFRNL